MKKQIKLLIENLFDDIYDDNNDLSSEIAEEHLKYNYYPKNKYDLEKLLGELLEKRGPDADLNDIDTSKINDMSYLFFQYDIQNIDISGWDVHNVTDMTRMFYQCNKFNSNLSNWNVSSVENMDGMFADCDMFNSDLSKWNVKKVEITANMFFGCHSFEGNGLENWELNECTNLNYMFSYCSSLKCNLTNWNILDNATGCKMFEGCCNSDFIYPEWYNKRFNINVNFLETQILKKYKNNYNIIDIINNQTYKGRKKYFGSHVNLWWLWWLILILKGPLSKKELLLLCDLEPSSYSSEFAKLSKQNIIKPYKHKLIAVY